VRSGTQSEPQSSSARDASRRGRSAPSAPRPASERSPKGLPRAGFPNAGFPDAAFPDAEWPNGGLPNDFPDAGLPNGLPDAGLPNDAFPDGGLPLGDLGSPSNAWSPRLLERGLPGTAARTHVRQTHVRQTHVRQTHGCQTHSCQRTCDRPNPDGHPLETSALRASLPLGTLHSIRRVLGRRPTRRPFTRRVDLLADRLGPWTTGGAVRLTRPLAGPLPSSGRPPEGVRFLGWGPLGGRDGRRMAAVLPRPRRAHTTRGFPNLPIQRGHRPVYSPESQHEPRSRRV
jgi:hypothetical protein